MTDYPPDYGYQENGWIDCPTCDGAGWLPDESDCPECLTRKIVPDPLLSRHTRMVLACQMSDGEQVP